MALRTGLRSSKEWHDSNTGMGFIPFKLKNDGDKAIVRVLAEAEPFTDPKTGEVKELEGRRYIRSIMMHRDFKKIKPTRCLSETDEPDEKACPLCRVKAPRSLRTYIPVRVRGDNEPKRVVFIEYGRDNLQEIIAVLEEIETEEITGTEHDITAIDFTVKRVGKDLDTKYKWFPIAKTARPLDADEKALEFEDPNEFIVLKPYDEVDKIAMDFERAGGAKKIDRENIASDEQPEDEIPF